MLSWYQDVYLGIKATIFGSPFPYSSGCRLPASLPLVGDGPICSQLTFWYCSVLCSVRGPAVPLIRGFRGKVLSLFPLFFFFPSLAIPWLGLLSHVSCLRQPSGHSGPVLTLRSAACASLFRNCVKLVSVASLSLNIFTQAIKSIQASGLCSLN